MKNKAIYSLFAAGVLMLFACCNSHSSNEQEITMEGHYSYQHAFNYDMDGNHFDVHETGTMDFFADSTALDSARQVYSVTYADGNTGTLVFNYISPSHWHLNGDTLHFAGLNGLFRMELVEGDSAGIELAQKIIKAYSGSNTYEYLFHLDTLTADLLKWSFTYRDGHSDTWEFHRVTE